MTADDLLKIAAVLVALSGWFKVFYDHRVSRPKIIGRVLSVIKGDMTFPDGSKAISYFVYPYLLNASKSSVHILDFELLVQISFLGGWMKVKKIYGADTLNPTFKSPGGGDIRFHGFGDRVIIGEKTLVQFGVPLHGWLPFARPTDCVKKERAKFKLVCTDAYGTKHVIKLNEKEDVGLPLLMELSGIELPEDMLNGRATMI
ncbi:hypothetical protein [Pseudomonas lurida]|uniref:hypothetical protein n=1 Tax=Pseudomonas lurida TaxID=244566 RepID=UPI002736639D|nr:hypothetical protein [Pseudomonas lurida]WLG26436.1 hypothetical protein PSH68_16600 [Pseudomonas lurida]